jgi:uncharacterized protein (TIGR03437 family)
MSRFSRIGGRNCVFAFILISIITLGVYHARTHAQVFTRVVVVSAATFEETAVAPNSIAVAFIVATNLPNASAQGLPLPTTLGGAQLRLIDSAGVSRDCGLFFVSSTQVNFLVPPETAPGSATISFTSPSTPLQTGTVQIATVSPGLFTANANGQGAVAGFLLSVPDQGGPSYESLSMLNQRQDAFIPRPVLLDRQTIQAERLFFVLFGTGLQAASGNVTAQIGGVSVNASFAGPIPGFVGLDQINIPIDQTMIRELTGRGRVNLALTATAPAGGVYASNLVEIEIANRQGPTPPLITSIEPLQALPRDIVTIKGSNLISGGGLNRVRVGGVEAQIAEASASELKIIVPFGAETGPMTVTTGMGESITQPLLIKTSISGVVEDTRRRPVLGATVRIYTLEQGVPSVTPLVTTTTDREGVFLAADAPTDKPIVLEIDSRTVSVSPTLPRIRLFPSVGAGKDNVIPYPISLQIPTGFGIKFTPDGLPARGASAVAPLTPGSYENDWTGLDPVDAEFEGPAKLSQQTCPSSGVGLSLISFIGRVLIPCETTEECTTPSRTLYFSSIESSRTPVSLPTGIFSSSMYQFSPYDTTFVSGVSLGLPNFDCLPPGPARVFKFQRSTSGFSVPSSDRFVDIGAATVSPDGLSLSISGSTINQGGIFFVSVKRQTATITGRVLEPDPTGGSSALVPVRRAVVLARGQQTTTDGAGFFILRNVPVMRSNDAVALEINWIRPNGRVERLTRPNLTVAENTIVAAGDLRLQVATLNRPPVILASLSAAPVVNERLDRSLSIHEADPGQPVQVSMTGPDFAALINRGDGRFGLRLTPGVSDVGDYTLNIRAVDNLGLISVAAISVRVAGEVINQPPTADPLSITTEEDKSVPITLTGKDPNGNALSFQLVTQPAHGQLSGVAPDLSYTPDANYFGPDSFTFKVNDGVVDSAPATISITVTPANDAPTLNPPGEQKVAAGTELRFVVSAVDADAADQLNLTAIDAPASAALAPAPTPSGVAVEFRWTPSQDQVGPVIVSFRVSDNAVPPSTQTRTVAISVTPAGAPPTAATWTPAAGPSGGSVGAVYANGSVVLAASYKGGVFRSTDNGESWTATGAGTFGQDPVVTFGNIGTTIIANTAFGLYRSVDNGLTWTVPRIALQGSVSLIGRPPAPFTIHGTRAFTTSVGLLLSSADGGENWARVDQRLPANLSISALASSGSNLFAGSTSGLVYRSQDNGQTWVLTTQGLPSNQSVDRLYANAGALFAIVSVNRGPTPLTTLYESTNQGLSWERLDTPVGSAVTSMIFTDDQWLVVVWGQFDFIGMRVYSFLRRPDRTLTATQLYESRFISALASSGTSLFAGTIGDGVIRSTDKGVGWKAVNAGLGALSVYAISSAGGNLYAATTDGVYISEDQGQTWRASNTGLGNQSTLLFVDPGWISPAVPPREITAIASIESAGQTVLFSAQTPRTINRSRDLGKTWEPLNLSSELFQLPISALFGFGSTIFAAAPRIAVVPGSAADVVLRSTDLGATWTPSGAGIPGGAPQAFSSIGATLFVAVADRVFLSINGGQSWSPTAIEWPSNTQVTALAVRGATLYAGTFGQGLYSSTTNGQSWTPITAGLPANSILTAIFVNGPNLFLLTPTDYDQLCPNGGVLINGRCFGGLIPGGNPPGLRPNFLLRAGGRVYFSPNLGAAWAPIGAGLPESGLTAIGGLGEKIFVGGKSGGIFARDF